MMDPTTAAIADQIAERDRLRSEVAQLAAEVVRLRSLVAEACCELDDTGGQFAARRAAEIRQLAGVEVA